MNIKNKQTNKQKTLQLTKAKEFDLLQDLSVPLKILMGTANLQEEKPSTAVFLRCVSRLGSPHRGTTAKTKALDLSSNLFCSGRDETRSFCCVPTAFLPSPCELASRFS